MATANLVLFVTVFTLGFYQFKSNGVSAEANLESCIPLRKTCDIVQNITKANNATPGGKDIIKQINSLSEATEQTQCLSALRSSMCISSMRACNYSLNSSRVNSTKEQACAKIRSNCTETVRKSFGSKFCGSTVIHGYNSSECVNVTVSKNGYCPYNDVYKVSIFIVFVA